MWNRLDGFLAHVLTKRPYPNLNQWMEQAYLQGRHQGDTGITGVMGPGLLGALPWPGPHHCFAAVLYGPLKSKPSVTLQHCVLLWESLCVGGGGGTSCSRWLAWPPCQSEESGKNRK